MKRILAGFLFFSISYACNSQIFNANSRIAGFIKVWGFVKYHHPFVANGSIDWDSVFVQNIRKISAAKTVVEYNRHLLATIQSVAPAPKIINKPIGDSLFTLNKTNLDWVISSTIFNADVKALIKNIDHNKNSGGNRYIKILNQTADFSGEKDYPTIKFPDADYRLLFLSRFWNIINYFAPYKYLTTNWDKVLLEFVPKTVNAGDTISYLKTLQQLAKSLNDGHAQVSLNGQNQFDLFFGNYTIPFYCQIIDKQLVVRDHGSDSVSKAFNIQRGDIILKIDGRNTATVIAERAQLISSSNLADLNHQLSRFILDGSSPKLELQLKRGTTIFTTSVKMLSTQHRDWAKLINYSGNEAGYKKINDSIVIVYAAGIWKDNFDAMKSLIKQSKAVIFDVRNYPQNDEFYYIPDQFLSKPTSIDYSTIAMPELPGYFQWRLNPNKIGHESDSAFKGKVVILCDERTQSQGEYSCMVLQNIPNAITIGSQTAGADGLVTYIPMSNGLNISYSGYGMFYPNKRQTQRVGIKIDISVKKTVEGIRDNRDEILERALEYVSKGK